MESLLKLLGIDPAAIAAEMETFAKGLRGELNRIHEKLDRIEAHYVNHGRTDEGETPAEEKIDEAGN